MLTAFRRWLLRLLFPELVLELTSLRLAVDGLTLGAAAKGQPRSLDCGHLDTTWAKDHDGVTRCRVCHERHELSRVRRVV